LSGTWVRISRCGVRDVSETGNEGTPFAVAVIFISPPGGKLKKAEPELGLAELVTVTVDVCPGGDKVTLPPPSITDQVVEPPPVEVSVVEGGHPAGFCPPKYQIVLPPLTMILGRTTTCATVVPK